MDGPLFFDGAAMAGFESFGIGPGHAAGLPPSAVLPGRHRKLGGKGKSLTPLGKPTPGTATLSADNAAWMARNTNVRFGAHVIDASEAMEGRRRSDLCFLFLLPFIYFQKRDGKNGRTPLFHPTPLPSLDPTPRYHLICI